MEEAPEPESARTSLRPEWLRWLTSSQILVTLPTLVISLALAYFSFVQADAARKMQRSGTWPYVSFETSNTSPDGKSEISFNLANDGVGPARLEAMEFVYRGKPMSTPLQFVHDCCAGSAPLAFISSDVGGVLRPGEKREFIKLTKTDQNAAIWNRLNDERWNVVVRTCYCSIFDDCWVFDSRDDKPQPVAVCPADWTKFAEHPNERPAGG